MENINRWISYATIGRVVFTIGIIKALWFLDIPSHVIKSTVDTHALKV
jgi:hypothetical protein